MRDVVFLPCINCEFFSGIVNCIIDDRDLYTEPLIACHCDNFLMKGLYAEDDVECILKELQKKVRKKNDISR